MKKLLSLVLALSMACSAFAPAVYAAEEAAPAETPAVVSLAGQEPETPAAEPTEAPAGTEEPAAEPTETPAETEEPAAEPTETPAETEEPAAEPTEAPAGTEEPAAEPTETPAETEEPAAEPTEAPAETEAPAAEPTEAPAETEEPAAEPTETPDAEPPAQQASEPARNAAADESILMYYDAEMDVYYGKLPLEAPEGGWVQVAEEYLSWPVDNDTNNYRQKILLYMQGAYWLFVNAGGESTDPFYRVTAQTADGSTEIEYPIVYEDAAPAEKPLYMYSPEGESSLYLSYGIQPTSAPVATDRDYTYQITLYNSALTLLGIEGQGVEVVSQPDAEGNFTVRYPSTMNAWEDEAGNGIARYWIYAKDAEGKLVCTSDALDNYPGRTYTTGLSWTQQPTWPLILSEEGVAVSPAFENWGEYCENWSEIGTVQADAVTAELRCANDETLVYPGQVTATYDAETDKVYVKIDQLPDDTDLNWQFYLTVPYVEGYTLQSRATNIYKASVQLSTEPIDPVLGTRAEATFRTQITRYNQANYEYEPFAPGGSWDVAFEEYNPGLVMAEGETLADYIDLSFDSATGVLTATAKKDITLEEGSDNVTLTVRLEGQTQESSVYGAVKVGMPSVYLDSPYPDWANLTSAEGVDLAPRDYIDGSYQPAWKNYGTPTGEVTAKLVNTNTEEDWSSHLTAAYDAAEDVVNVKLDALPDTSESPWYLTLYIPCEEGYTLVSEQSINKAYISLSLNAASGLGNIGLTAGSTAIYTVYDRSDYNNPVPMTLDDSWTLNLHSYSNNFVFASGEDINDYVQAAIVDGKIRLTVLKDLTLNEELDSGTIQVELSSPVYRSGSMTVSAGAASLNITMVSEDQRPIGLELAEGATLTAYPALYRNNDYIRLDEVNLDYTLDVYKDGRPFAEQDDYFDLTLHDDGSFTITVKAVPPLYDFDSNQSLSYALYISSPDKVFTTTQMATFTISLDEVKLRQNGTTVYALPTKAGSYTYEFGLTRTVNGIEQDVELPQADLVSLTSDLYAGGVSLSKDLYSVTLDPAAKTLTFTLRQDLEADAANLSLSGYWGDRCRFTGYLSVGKITISLATARVDGESAYYFSETGTQYMITGRSDSGYLPGSALADESFIIQAVENGVEVPLEEAEYFGATIQDGLLTITIKQRPEVDEYGEWGITIGYSDDHYATNYPERINYQLTGSSSYYTPSFRDVETDQTLQIIPAGTPGTTTQYRVMGGSQLATQAMEGSLKGFTLTTTGNFDIGEYVKMSFNATNSVLSFEWLKELPLRSEDGSTTYRFLLTPEVDGSSRNTLGTASLFTVNSRIYDGASDEFGYTMAVGLGATSQYRAPNPIVDGTLRYSITNGLGQPVDPGQLSLQVDEFGALLLTASKDCPVGTYKLAASAYVSVGGGFASWDPGAVDILVSESGRGKVEYQYMWTDTFGTSSGLVQSGDSINLSLTSANTDFSLLLPENSPATDFTIEGLTFGKAEKVAAGNYKITMDRDAVQSGSQKQTLTLTATLPDGTTETAEVTLQISLREVDFEVVDGNTTYVTGQLFRSSIWTVGREYQIYPRLEGKRLSEQGAALDNAFLDKQEYFKITEVAADYFTVVPQKALSADASSGNFAQMYLNIRKANGDILPFNSYCYPGTVMANGARLQFIDTATGAKTSELRARYGAQDFTLKLSEDLGAGTTVTYGTNVPDSVTWEETDTVGVVKVHVKDYIHVDENYFYATVTRADGSQTSAYVQLTWSDLFDYTDNTLPTGQRIYFGSKGEDNAFDTWSGSLYTRSEGKTYTGKLYVFFGRDNNGTRIFDEWPDCVEKIEVTAADTDAGKVTVLRQGKENGMWFFEYQVDASDYGRYELTANVTLTNGIVRHETYDLTVYEAPQRSSATVQNGTQLQQALTSATLLPGTLIYLAPGEYNGAFQADVPVYLQAQKLHILTYNEDGSLQPRSESARVNGSITALTEEVVVTGLDFVGDGTGVAVTDARSVMHNTFTNYDTAVEIERSIHNSISESVHGNAFLDNNTAVRFVEREWHTDLTGNTFWHNDTALAFASGCDISGQYSTIFNATTTRGSLTENRFFLQDGQLALNNASRNQAMVNLTYNYFQRGDTITPQADMFVGPAAYSPYYTTPDCEAVDTDETLEGNLEEGSTTSVLTLTTAQGSSNTNTAQSSLQLSTSKFDELENSDKVNTLQINVQSTSNETDVVWTFDKKDLKKDYEGSSINMGVAFTFTDFEYDTINEIVRKTAEEIGDDPETGEPVSDTLGSIAYQAMCFSHSGDLPGLATVKVRMNESLLDYYASHGNSMKDFKIYYFNEETGVLETMDKTITVAEENGTWYMSFQIDHCSSYIVTPEELLTGVTGFLKILLNQDNNGGYTLADDLLDRVDVGSRVADVLTHLLGGAMTVLDLNGKEVNAIIGTGYTIGLGDGTVSPITVAVGGDLTGDGLINVSDLVEMRRAAISLTTLEGAWLKAATPVSGAALPGNEDLLQMRRVILEMADSMYD